MKTFRQEWISVHFKKVKFKLMSIPGQHEVWKSFKSVLWEEEMGVLTENHWPVARYWQTSLHKLVDF
jgi:hypothetical protein